YFSSNSGGISPEASVTIATFCFAIMNTTPFCLNYYLKRIHPFNYCVLTHLKNVLALNYQVFIRCKRNGLTIHVKSK
ncbi:MAG: hypothetical protein ACTSO7_13625, partial [Candidatus Heimdallarchaeota archaeon]